MADLSSLLVQPLEYFNWRKWNALVNFVQALTLRRSRHVRLDRGPDGIKVKFKGGRGGVALPSTPLRVAVVTTAEGKPAVTVSKGLIGGHEPQIDGRPVSKLDADGNPPMQVFDPAKVIDPQTGIGLLYARVSLASDYSIAKVELEATAKPPGIVAWKGYKLLAFLRRTPAEDPEGTIMALQRVFFDLGHTTTQRAGGKARHWFWAM